jgi:hypothetical protein
MADSLTSYVVSGAIGLAVAYGVVNQSLINITGLAGTIIGFIIPLFAFVIIKNLLASN